MTRLKDKVFAAVVGTRRMTVYEVCWALRQDITPFGSYQSVSKALRELVAEGALEREWAIQSNATWAYEYWRSVRT